MTIKYDIHLSAFEISRKSIIDFEILGFQRDEFANNTRCEITAYHGTYRGKDHLPNTDLWNKLCNVLEKDELFMGGLEEEEFDADSTMIFINSGMEIKPLLPAMITEQPRPNVYKACDIHINIDLGKSDPYILKCLEALEVASFDKPKDGRIHRVYTITTETLEDGQKAFSIIGNYLNGMMGIVGKMKLEKTTRFFRKPSNAYVLPLINKSNFQTWLKQFEAFYVREF